MGAIATQASTSRSAVAWVDEAGLDEHGGVVVEVLDGEDAVDAGGDAFLLVQVGGVDGEDRWVRRGPVAKALISALLNWRNQAMLLPRTERVGCP
jgi:hypothetical protein